MTPRPWRLQAHISNTRNTFQMLTNAPTRHWTLAQRRAWFARTQLATTFATANQDIKRLELLRFAKVSICCIRPHKFSERRRVITCNSSYSDINECVSPGACIGGQCIDEAGSYRCVCFEGYEYDEQGRRCVGEFSSLPSINIGSGFEYDVRSWSWITRHQNVWIFRYQV